MEESKIVEMLQDPLRKEQGLAALMRSFQKGLYWHAKQMLGSHEDTDDVLQNTFVKVWRHFDGFRAESSLKTWVYRIATNECLNHLEKRKRMQLADLRDIENSGAHSVQVASAISGEAIQEKLQLAVQALPDKQRQVFLLKYYEEMKYSEIVQVLGGTEGSLKASFHHAVKKIEDFLTKD